MSAVGVNRRAKVGDEVRLGAYGCVYGSHSLLLVTHHIGKPGPRAVMEWNELPECLRITTVVIGGWKIKSGQNA